MSKGSRQPPVLSPVDYDAWSRGYMPPSEHVLIDALHRGSAKVELSFSLGKDGHVWIAHRGADLSRRARRKLMAMLQAVDEIVGEDEEAEASGTEAHRAETRSGSVEDEGPAPHSGETPSQSPDPLSQTVAPSTEEKE